MLPLVALFDIDGTLIDGQGAGRRAMEAGMTEVVGPGHGLDTLRFGGYGCDHEDRAQLIGVAAQRGAARLHRAPEDCRVVVIGDTPRDVAAAQAIGARSLGVGTAWHDAASLRQAGATWAVDDLTDPAARQALLSP